LQSTKGKGVSEGRKYPHKTLQLQRSSPTKDRLGPARSRLQRQAATPTPVGYLGPEGWPAIAQNTPFPPPGKLGGEATRGQAYATTTPRWSTSSSRHGRGTVVPEVMAERPKPARGNAKPSANPRGRAQEIYAELRQLLLVGGWPLFERLVEVRLANRFGTSRTPVREALLRLEAEGLIERRGGDGFYPKVPNLPAVKQLYEVRKILELGALRLPGESGGRHDQKRLAELRDEWLEILERPPVADPDFVLNDERFHLTLVAAAGNQAIVDHLRLVNEQIRIVRMHEFIDPDRTARTARQHLAILDAVLAEEIEEAVELLSSHIDEVAKEAAARTVRALERMIAPAAHGGSERPAAATTDLQPGAEAGIN
jgi:DNA-binding GntR family transcriptional regulator